MGTNLRSTKGASSAETSSSAVLKKAGQLLTTHNALAVDMEAAAIAHTCEINKVPFLCVRAMSDKADHSANVSFTDFLVAATDNYGKVFDKIIQQLGK
ncbi:MAG: hypothetical protein IPJ47_14830 [Anaerolineales bacterium]|nr:hypothetical protein [Anaerolineales bacterium]